MLPLSIMLTVEALGPIVSVMAKGINHKKANRRPYLTGAERARSVPIHGGPHTNIKRAPVRAINPKSPEGRAIAARINGR